jgi:hypothetical protein
MNTTKQGKCKWKECRKPFVAGVEWQKFCSPKCRAANYYARRAKESRLFRKMMEKRVGA